MKELLQDIRNCHVCEDHLSMGCRPVLSVDPESKIVLIGQAPGLKVHQSGVPWQDKSGDNLREWLGLSLEEFYDPKIIGIIPMGFCYPGKGRSGDLPPRKECAPLWHDQLLKQLTNEKLTLLIGQYSQNYYLGSRKGTTLTQTVAEYQNYLPKYFPLPHPSPRNNIWKSKNPWFEKDLLPDLKIRIRSIIENG